MDFSGVFKDQTIQYSDSTGIYMFLSISCMGIVETSESLLPKTETRQSFTNIIIKLLGNAIKQEKLETEKLKNQKIIYIYIN